MAKISVKNAAVKGYHDYLSGTNIGDIYDCYPKPQNNAHDHYAIVVQNEGNVFGYLPKGFAGHIYILFVELKDNITILW